jgi:hypothetical protein
MGHRQRVADHALDRSPPEPLGNQNAPWIIARITFGLRSFANSGVSICSVWLHAKGGPRLSSVIANPSPDWLGARPRWRKIAALKKTLFLTAGTTIE